MRSRGERREERRGRDKVCSRQDDRYSFLQVDGRAKTVAPLER